MQKVVWSVGRPLLGGCLDGVSILAETCLNFVKKNVCTVQVETQHSNLAKTELKRR